jgi:uncharacterized protein
VKTASLRRNGVVLVDQLEIAETVPERMNGLLGRQTLAGKGFLIPRCGSVHTFFMRFSLDLVFMDSESTVCRVVSHVPPFRVVWGGWGAVSVLELECGWLGEDAVRPGDRLEVY